MPNDISETLEQTHKENETPEQQIQRLKSDCTFLKGRYDTMRKRAEVRISYASAIRTFKEAEDKLVANTNRSSWWITGVKASYGHCITDIRQPKFD